MRLFAPEFFQQAAVRKALLYYALRRLGLDTDPSARRPQDQQIVLLNHDKIKTKALVQNEK